MFQEEIISTGFRVIAYSHLEQITKSIPLKVLSETGHFFKSSDVAYFLSKYFTAKQATEIARKNSFVLFVLMTEKYRCSIYKLNGDKAEKIYSDEKPKNALKIMLNLLGN